MLHFLSAQQYGRILTARDLTSTVAHTVASAMAGLITGRFESSSAIFKLLIHSSPMERMFLLSLLFQALCWALYERPLP